MKPYLFLALGLLASTAAHGAVSLAFNDGVGNPTSVTVAPGQSFNVTLTLTSTAELTGGIEYFLEAIGSGSSQFRITARDISLTSFADLTTTDGIALAAPNALLDGTNDNDLGGLTSGAANGVGTFTVATFTIQALPGIAEGDYTIETDSVIVIDENFEEISGVTSPSYSVTVIPEPATSLLACLGLTGLLIRKRK